MQTNQTKQRIAEKLGAFSTGMARGQIKMKVSPYVDELEKAGFSENEFRILVERGVSFYDNYMPPSWKKALISQVKQYKSWIDEARNDEGSIQELMKLGMSAMADIRPWIPKVITPKYLRSEIERFLRDVR